MLRNRLYYSLKPLIPWSVRMAVRRHFAQRKRARVTDVWPIAPGSEKSPAGWPGWPDGKQFAFVLTHDVEGTAGLSKVKPLAELEMSMGFRSCFNFIPEGSYRVPAELRAWLTDRGFEVGVHDLRHDGKLYRSRAGFHANAARINHYLREWGAVGFRSGFMLREMHWLHDLNIQYDASMFDTDPFEPQPHGAHTIFPFWVPARRLEVRSQKSEQTANLRPQSAGDGEPSSVLCPPSSGRPGYVELPYTLAQDSTLFLLLHERTPDIWLQKLDWIAAHGGMALVNVHPDYIHFERESSSPRTYPVAHYRQLLLHVREHHEGKYWHAVPRDLADMYNREVSSRRIPPLNPQPAANGRVDSRLPLRGKRAAVILYSYYATDPRPRREAQSLIRAGMDVDVICLRKEPGAPLRQSLDGANVFCVPMKRRRERKLVYAIQYTGFLLASMALISFGCLRKRYRLVHVHNMPDFLVFSAILPRLLGAKVILDLHDPMPELFRSIYSLDQDNWLVRLLKSSERLSIRMAHYVITPNLAFKELFASRSCPPEKIQIVMNTPQTEIFHPGPSADRTALSSPDSFELMYHGLLVERHGLDIAIRAVARLKPRIPQIKLHLFGEPTPYMNEIQCLITELGLESVVTYHGFKPLEEIAVAIRKIHLGLIPNRRNPFTEVNMPTRIFEYLAMQKPLVAPRTRGISDYFDETQMIFFTPDSVEDLASRIEWAFFHPAEVAEILERGCKVYHEHRWEVEELKLLTVVSRLLKVQMPETLRPDVRTLDHPTGDEPEHQSRQTTPNELCRREP